jgi:hypothetical protein
VTRQEFSKIMAFLSAAIDKPLSKATVEAYFEMLGDLQYNLAMAAVQKIIATDEYPVLPTIGKIRTAAAELTRPHKLTAPEAWGLVLSAIHQHGYYNPEKALESMPPDVGEVVRWMGWQELCHSDNVDVIRAQFMRMYDTQEGRRRETEMLPPVVKNYLAEVGQKLKLIGGGG